MIFLNDQIKNLSRFPLKKMSNSQRKWEITLAYTTRPKNLTKTKTFVSIPAELFTQTKKGYIKYKYGIRPLCPMWIIPDKAFCLLLVPKFKIKFELLCQYLVTVRQYQKQNYFILTYQNIDRIPEKIFPIVKLQFLHKILIGLQGFSFIVNFSNSIFFSYFSLGLFYLLKEHESELLHLLFLGFSKWMILNATWGEYILQKLALFIVSNCLKISLVNFSYC